MRNSNDLTTNACDPILINKPKQLVIAWAFVGHKVAVPLVGACVAFEGNRHNVEVHFLSYEKINDGDNETNNEKSDCTKGFKDTHFELQ